MFEGEKFLGQPVLIGIFEGVIFSCDKIHHLDGLSSKLFEITFGYGQFVTAYYNCFTKCVAMILPSLSP